MLRVLDLNHRISYSCWQLTEEPPRQHGVVYLCQQGYQDVLDASIRPHSSYKHTSKLQAL